MTELESTRLKGVSPGISGWSGTIFKNLSSSALNASTLHLFAFKSRMCLGIELNSQGPGVTGSRSVWI